jgi:hypothetical protein
MASKAQFSESLAEKWASRGRQGLSLTQLRDLLRKQNYRCNLSGAPLIFDKELGTPQKGGPGVHPLYPTVDHIECGTAKRDHQIVCYALNDVKGHLPYECFEALRSTAPWNKLMKRWCSLAESDPHNRDAFTELIFPNGNRRKRLEGAIHVPAVKDTKIL